MILTRYLMRAYLVRFAAFLIGLVVFLQTLDLLAEANSVFAGGGPPIISLLRYVTLRAPSLAQTIAPLAALLAGLLALVGMARSSEILAMRAAGRSVFSLVGGLVICGIVLSLGFFVFTEYVEVPANSALQEWKDAGYKTEGHVESSDNSWLVEGDTYIRVSKVMREGTVLNDVRVFKQGADASIVDILGVRLAVWENNQWTMFDVRRLGGTNTDSAPPTWNTTLKPEQFLRFANHPDELSMNALKEYVGNVAVGSRPPYFYDTWLQQKFAGPMVLALMPLLAALAAFAHHRQGTPIMTVVWGVTFGFMFVVIDNILLAMGQFGSLPPLLAAWLPIALFATAGIWVLFTLEHTGVRT